MKTLLGNLPYALLTTACLNSAAQAQTPPAAPGQTPPTAILFENVRIFDGKGMALSAPSHVLVRGNVIERISTTPIPVDRRADTRIVNGGGRTLMPGLIDAHSHMAMSVVPISLLMSADPNYSMLR